MLIRLGKLDKNYLLLIFGAISYIIRSYSFNFSYANNNPLYMTFIMAFGQSFSIFIENFVECQFKAREKQVTVVKEGILQSVLERVKFKTQQISSFHLFIGSFFVATMNLIGAIALNMVNATQTNEILLGIDRSMEFTMNVILCPLLLNYRFYRHHLMGISIILIGIITVSIIVSFEDTGLFQFRNTIFLLIGGVQLGTREVITRFLTYNCSVSPFKLLTYSGIGIMIGTVVLCFFLKLSDCSDMVKFCDKNYGTFSFSFCFEILGNHIKEYPLLILSSIMYAFFSMVYNTFYFLIIYHLGPTYRITSDFLAVTCKTILQMIFGESPFNNSLFVIISFAVLITGALVYNEIIVLCFWGLDKNCKVTVDERAYQEQAADINDFQMFSEMEKAKSEGKVAQVKKAELYEKFHGANTDGVFTDSNDNQEYQDDDD